VIIRETGGQHIYCASLAQLEEDGLRELAKRHLAINADKYLGIGSWKSIRGTYDNDMVALCMKSEKHFKVSDLLAMKPLAERGYTVEGRGGVKVPVKDRHLVDDGRDNMIPENPDSLSAEGARRRAIPAGAPVRPREALDAIPLQLLCQTERPRGAEDLCPSLRVSRSSECVGYRVELPRPGSTSSILIDAVVAFARFSGEMLAGDHGRASLQATRPNRLHGDLAA